jgi:hypothetical protein
MAVYIGSSYTLALDMIRDDVCDTPHYLYGKLLEADEDMY